MKLMKYIPMKTIKRLMVMESLAIRIPATRKGTLGVGCHQAPPEEEGGADDDGVYPGDPGPQLVGEEDARHHPQQAWTPSGRLPPTAPPAAHVIAPKAKGTCSVEMGGI